MDLPLDPTLKFGLQTIQRIAEPTDPNWRPTIDDCAVVVELADRLGFDSVWTGDHIAFPLPILDPLIQMAQAAVISRRMTVGSCVYLLPLRNPVTVAKQVATLDHLTDGRFVFGVGLGGEFPREWEACGVPVAERGARMTESLQMLRKLWSGEAVSHEGRFFRFPEIQLAPVPRTPGGPPIWCGGRQPQALRRIARLADGWMSYVVTPEMYRQGLETIAATAAAEGRGFSRFGTGHLLYARIDSSYDKALDFATDMLSHRYNMDFRKAAQRYAAIGTAQDVAARLRDFHAAGVRHLVLDFLGTVEERPDQMRQFAEEVRPLLADLI
ncbi:MAG: LLM class flavin-dependent oxidoreductase [Alphaproteobacteria bacterium]